MKGSFKEIIRTLKGDGKEIGREIGRRLKVTSERMEDAGRVIVFDPCYFFTILFAWLYSVFNSVLCARFCANSVICRYLEEES